MAKAEATSETEIAKLQAENRALRQQVADLHTVIAARKQAEAALRESEDRYRSLFENANDGIACLTADGIITSVNRGLEAMLGWSRQEMIGQGYQKFHTPSSLTAEAERIRRFRAGEKVSSISEIELVHKDGSVIPVEARTRFIRNQDGEAIGVLAILRNLTARKRAEENIQVYAEIVRNMQIGLYVYQLEDINDDRTLRMVATNPAATQFTGVAMESVVGRTLDENFPGLRAQGIPQTYAEVVRSGQAVELENVSYGDAHVLHGAFAIKAFPLPNQCMGVVFENITARKQAEEALRRSERFNASLITQSPLGIVTYTPDGNVASVNPAWEKIWGVPWEQVKDYNVWSDPQLFSTPLREALERLVEQGGTLPPFELEYDIGTTLPGGNRRWTSCKFYAVQEENGEVTALVCLNEDITARKRAEEALRQAEEKYRSIFENAIEGIFQTTPSGAILSANPALTRMLGYESPEELKAQVTNIGTQLYVDPHRRAEVLAMLREQGTVHGVESQLSCKDGSKFWASVSVQAVRDATGTLLYYEGSLEDITRRRAVDELKGEFVSLVSHELRTPLTSIRGSLGLLASGLLGPLPDKGQRMLDIAVRNTDRLVRLINDILDVERIQSGKVSMVKTICTAADLITHAVEVMRAMAEKAEVTLTVQPVQAQLWADPDRIIQTLTNLLSNAIKFSFAGTTVWLTAEQRGEQLLIQVKDQGRGIPAEKLESIFERFQQVDASDSREKGGTGLGLAICRSIVQQHGGRIWAESTLGKGSIFAFTLPLGKEGQPTVPAASLSPSVIAGHAQGSALVATDGHTRRLQVLVAEEDRDLAGVLIAMFERHGGVVYYAQTGAEAIQCCDFVVPDLLVLDPVMPEHDGFAVVNWMRQQDRLCQIPVVVYAAGELTAADQQRLTLGPTQFFTKSRIPPEQFEQQVMQWLDRLLLAREGDCSYDDNSAPSRC